MASFNSSFFYLGLLVAISAFMAAPSSVEAQINLPAGIVTVNGTVACTLNVTVSGSSPPFSNASVQLQCGNKTVGNTTTNAAGIFSIVVRPLQDVLLILSSLLRGGAGCRVIVNTPLAQCNSTLPGVGNLAGNITQVAVNTVNGLPVYTLLLSLLQYLGI